jgi:hypothetical protein
MKPASMFIEAIVIVAAAIAIVLDIFYWRP